MKAKRYQAEDMAQACELIRRDFGPDAVILSTRTVRPNGMLGLLKRPMVEVVAGPGDDGTDGVSADISATARRTLSGGTNGQSPAPAEERSASRAFQALLERVTKEQDTVPPIPAIRGRKAEPKGVEPPGLRELERSVAEIKETLAKLAARPTAPGRLTLPEPLITYYERLRQQGVDEPLIEALLTGVREELNPRDFDNEDLVTDAVARRLAGELPQPRRLHLVSGRTQVVFLVGPTGAGKTTTLIKLAAHLTRSDLRVLLVTTDVVRVGAVAQVQAYADLLGLDLCTAYNAADLRAIVQDDDGHDVLLIDTPGRNPNDSEQMDELRELLGAVRRKQVYLTLPANMDAQEMAAALDRFEQAPINGLIFSKLDEAIAYGPVVNTLHRTRRPAAFMADGQDVLGDLEPASIRRLARLALLGPKEAEEADDSLARSA